MAEEAEDEDRPAEDYAYVPPAHPEFVRFRNQLLACSSPLLGAVAAGMGSTDYVKKTQDYHLNLGWDFDYIYWHPMIADVPGIILAVPLLRFGGRWLALVVSQLIFLLTLVFNEYFHMQQSGSGVHVRLREEFLWAVVMRGCVRLYFVVMVVYMAEVTQPSYRGPMLAAFFPCFVLGLYLGFFHVGAEKLRYSLITMSLSFLFALVAPESPYWLMHTGDEDGARNVFRRLRAGDDDADELAAMREIFSQDAELPPLKFSFPSALAKMVFLYMGTDSVCRVFMPSLPSHFFRYDNVFEHEHEQYYEPDVTHQHSKQQMHLPPIFGSLAFVLVCPFFGRRVLYLISIAFTFVIFFIRKKFVTNDMKDARILIAELCYFVSNMGAKQVVLLVTGEIFPGKLRELGVAICELLQFVWQVADYTFVEEGVEWRHYYTLRVVLILIGILLTFLFLPETRNKTLVETEIAGAKMVPVFLSRPVPTDLELDEEEVENEN